MRKGSEMQNAAEIRTLLVTPDAWLVKNFTDISRELGIDAQKSAKPVGIPEELGRTKYEAVLVDFDNVTDTSSILARVRASPANRNAVIFAVASGTSREQALEQGANFVFARPLEPKEIRRILYAAYDLMARERRRYFRCTAELPVLLTQASAGTDVRCETINISSTGMALTTPSPMNPGEEVRIILFLQATGPVVRATGTVVWDDKHGKTGLRFQCSIQRDQTELEGWLDSNFDKLLAPGPANS
jgi:c-di-GMP-binding flagellar brake protein YcgR